MEAIDRARQGTYDPSTVYQFPNINQMMIQKRPVPSGDTELTEVDVAD